MIILFTIGLLLAYAAALYVIWSVLNVGETFKLLITLVVCIPMITFVRNFLMRVVASSVHKKVEAEKAAKAAAEEAVEEAKEAGEAVEETAGEAEEPAGAVEEAAGEAEDTQ